MKKEVYTLEGRFLGTATKIAKTETGIEITMLGDFPGMLERTVIYWENPITYEDENRIYVKY